MLRGIAGGSGSGGGGSGTVASVSVASANGLAGTVTNPTTTPAITLSTSITGLLKGNGTAISAATAGTDYVVPGDFTAPVITATGTFDGPIGENSFQSGNFSTLTAATYIINTRIQQRVSLTNAPGAEPILNTDAEDEMHFTGLNTNITSFTTNLTGTPVTGDIIVIELTDDGTARTIAWGTSFESSTVTLPVTTVISQLLTVTLKWNAVTSKWRCVGVC